MATQVGKAPVFIQGSAWTIENVIEVPMDSVLGDPAFVYVNVFSVIFRATVLLERIFTRKKTKGRSAKRIDQDQFNIFQSLERSLSRTGIDGRACMLRTVCEMQEQRLNQYTVLGEVLTALFTPKRGPGNFMQQYLDAEEVGRNSPKACATTYAKCPMSLFSVFRQQPDNNSNPSNGKQPQRNSYANRLPDSNGSKQASSADDDLKKGRGGKSIFGGLADGEHEYHDCYLA